MAERDSGDGGNRQDRGGLKSRLLSSFMTPIVAAAASAAAGYAAQKAPAFVERNVLPRLKSLAGDAGGAAQDLPGKAKSVASGAGDVAQELGERAKTLVASNTSRGPRRSPAEIARRQQQRARSRADRRKAGAR